jgi:dimethylglycine dehydrogenase
VLAADGRCIGVTTSGAYGHRVKKSLVFASVEPAFEAAGSTFDILLQGEARRATVLPAPAFDADNSRMRI